MNASVTGDNPITFDNSIIDTDPNLATGDEVVYQASGGAAIGGLVNGQTYYVIRDDPSTIQLATTLANAQNGVAIGMSSTGNDAQTLTKLAAAPVLTFNPTNDSVTGNEIYPVTLKESSGTLVITSNGPSIAITGGDAETPLLGNPTTTSITAGQSITGRTAANLTTLGSTSHTLNLTINGTAETITIPAGTYTADSLAAAVQSAINAAVLSQDGVQTGLQVVYSDNGGTDIDGLTEGATYAIIVAPDNGIELVPVANWPTPTTLGPNLGSGTGHTLTPIVGPVDHIDQADVSFVPVNNSIGFSSAPGLYTGEPVVYNDNGGTPIGGLSNNTSQNPYYVISLNKMTGSPGVTIAPADPNSPYPNDPSITRTTGNWLDDGFRPGQTIQVSGATNDNNNTSFTVDAISGTVLYLNPDPTVTVTQETDASGVSVGINDPTQIQLAASAQDAINGNPITLTSGGSGSFTLPEPTSNVTAYIDSSQVTSTNGRVIVLSGVTDPTLLSNPGPIATATRTITGSDVTTSGDTIQFSGADNLTTGQEVVYHAGTGAPIGGLQDGHTYYVIVAGPNTIKLASTYADAVSPTPVGDTVQSVSTSTVTSNPNQITLASDPGLYTGEALVYNVGSGTAIGGLTDGSTYYVITTPSSGVIQLADSLNDANNGNPISLTSSGSGSFMVPTSSTPITLTSTGGSGQSIAPVDTTNTATFNPSGQTGSVAAANFTVTASDSNVLTITSNGAAVTLDGNGGDAVAGLLGTPTTSGEAITGSTGVTLPLTITTGTNDTLKLTVNGTTVTVTLAAGTYNHIDALTALVQSALRQRHADGFECDYLYRCPRTFKRPGGRLPQQCGHDRHSE